MVRRAGHDFAGGRETGAPKNMKGSMMLVASNSARFTAGPSRGLPGEVFFESAGAYATSAEKNDAAPVGERVRHRLGVILSDLGEVRHDLEATLGRAFNVGFTVSEAPNTDPTVPNGGLMGEIENILSDVELVIQAIKVRERDIRQIV